MTFIKNIKKTAKKIADWKKFEKNIKPAFDFGKKEQPAQPNYGNIDHWFAHPEKSSKVRFTPEGVPPNDAWNNGEVDVFFIAPTLTFSSLYWNAPINHPSSTELITEMIMPGQASVFNSCCRIFSPKYRQATFYSFLGAGKNGRSALELAYQDCLAALDYYLKNYNQGRPFFLAGHSQGALHTMRLLEERIDNSEIVKKMVAAYPIGFWFPMDKFGTTLKTISPAEKPTDTQCVVAYDTYLDTGKPMRLLDRAEVVYARNGGTKWVRRVQKTPLGVNPLNWQRNSTIVPDSQHKGAVHTVFESQQKPNWAAMASETRTGINCTGLSKPYPQECNAQIRKDGILYVSSPKNRAFKNMIMPSGNLHLFDYPLFYMNLRENIQERWRVFNGC